MSKVKEEEINIISDVEALHIQLDIYISKLIKPIQAITFININAASLMLNLVVLPEDQWIPYFKNFNTI